MTELLVLAALAIGYALNHYVTMLREALSDRRATREER